MIKEEIIQAILDFLDDTQEEIIEYNEEDRFPLLGYLQDITAEIINSDLIFDNEIEAEKEAEKQVKSPNKEKQLFANKIKNIRKKISNGYFSDVEMKKLYKYFSVLKEELSKQLSDTENESSVEHEEDVDDKITINELNALRFEEYYNKRKKSKELKESKSLTKMMKDLGLDLPKK
tara:strand:- start:2182 stop:2709 length:528 start_codon:yes stop_codon:yes gene_type:complete